MPRPVYVPPDVHVTLPPPKLRTALKKKIADADLSEFAKDLLMECVSVAHMRGVRFGSEPRCDENVAFVLKELGLL